MEAPHCEEVIVMSRHREGSGKDQGSPIRIITEVFRKDGTLIAAFDPNGMYTIEDLIDLARFIAPADAPVNHVLRWIKETGNR